MNIPNFGNLGNMDLGALKDAKNQWDAFQRRHPNFPKFLKYIAGKDMPEGTKVTITVEYPNGQKVDSSLNLQPEDAAVFKNFSKFM